MSHTIYDTGMQRNQRTEEQQSGRLMAEQHVTARSRPRQADARGIGGPTLAHRATQMEGSSGFSSTSFRSRSRIALAQEDWLTQPELEDRDVLVQDNARPIPTLQTLRQDRDIQQRVQHRFQELEQLQQPEKVTWTY